MPSSGSWLCSLVLVWYVIWHGEKASSFGNMPNRSRVSGYRISKEGLNHLERLGAPREVGWKKQNENLNALN